MPAKKNGRLIIIGGHEGSDEIMKEVIAPVRHGKGLLLVVTVATADPEGMAKKYLEVFTDLGVENLDFLDIRTREEGKDPERVEKVKKASVIFFTGGDQLRIASQIGDSPVYQCIEERYQSGCTIAGTSAGAAVLPANMLIFGGGDESFRAYELGMAAGLGLIDGVIVDTHFAERGRIGRLLGAVAQNPRNVGIGIDEDTAIMIENHSTQLTVIGAGSVYIIDGSTITYSSLSQDQDKEPVSMFDIRLHVLTSGDIFDLVKRVPVETNDAELKAASGE